MATTHSAKVILSIEAREVIAVGIQRGVIPVRVAEQIDLTTGTADGQINQAYYTRVTGVGAAVTTVYDLVGSLTDLEGNTLNFDEVVLIYVKNLSSTPANFLHVGPDATAGFGVIAANRGFWADASDRNVLMGDGRSWLCLYSDDGVPAAAGSTDELAIITQGGTSANTWEIVILGRDN